MAMTAALTHEIFSSNGMTIASSLRAAPLWGLLMMSEMFDMTYCKAMQT
jgi:hypothetical protein